MNFGRDVSRLLTRRRRRAQGAIPLALSAAGVGAGVMYLLDPDRGARRRAIARDRSVHAAHRVGEIIEKGSRDLRFRVRGFAAEVRSLARDDQPSDQLLVERVRAKLGRAVSHPHAVCVDAKDGRVVLSGAVLRHELPHLLGTVYGVPGVKDVEDKLDPHTEAEQIPALQGSRRRSSGRNADRWAPVTRVAMGAVGAGLLAYGLARRGSLGLLLGGAGAAVLARDIQNRPLPRLFGIGAGVRAVDFHKTIHVHAPVERVFSLFADVEQFPRFMSHVREVKKLDENRYHWVVEGPARVPVSWDAEVTAAVPNKVFAWQSAEGAVIKNAGVVRFDPEGECCTRMDIQMSYNPPAGAVGHLIASIFGADPKHALDEDLVRFQSLLERGKTTAHHREVRAEDVGLKRG